MSDLFASLSSVLTVESFMAAAFFFRFRKNTGDGIFTVFGLAFVVFGLEHVLVLADHARLAEAHPLVYLVRSLGFVLILWGIAQKNRRATS